MNVSLNRVRQVMPTGDVLEMDFLSISGSTIRYVHIPENISIVRHINSYMKTIDRTSVSKGMRKIVDRKKKAEDEEDPRYR